MRPARVILVALVALIALGCRESGDRPRAVPGGDPARGQRLVADYGCGSCHMVPGIPAAVGRVGPPFEGFAERRFIAGNLPNEPNRLVEWIRFPQQIEPGTVMPNLGVTAQHATDIAAYLYTLRGGGLGPPHLIPAKVLH